MVIFTFLHYGFQKPVLNPPGRHITPRHCQNQTQINQLIPPLTPQREPVQINGVGSRISLPNAASTSQRSDSRRERLGLSCISDHRPPDKSTNRPPSAAPDAAACQTGSADIWLEGLQILYFPLPNCFTPQPPNPPRLCRLCLFFPSTITVVACSRFCADAHQFLMK